MMTLPSTTTSPSTSAVLTSPSLPQGLNQAFIISGESGRDLANLKKELYNVLNVILEAFRQCQDSVHNHSSRFVRTSLPTELVLFCSFYSFSFIPFFLFFVFPVFPLIYFAGQVH